MKYLTVLKLKAQKANKIRAKIRAEINRRDENLAGLKKQVNQVAKVSKVGGKEAAKRLKEFTEKQAKDYGSAFTSSKIQTPKNPFSKLQYQRQQIKVASAANEISDESLEPTYDSTGMSNLITSAAVKSAKAYGVKVKKVRKTPNERPTYKVDYSDVPKDKKAAAKVAIRRARRHLAGRGVTVINQLMALIKKTYYGNAKIQGSDQVFQAVIDVAKDVHGDVTSENAQDLIDKVMKSV